jgi:regulator of protease activity HflC (stomatin/prohibitin superfamily)
MDDFEAMPLALVAGELNLSADDLAARLGPEAVEVDDTSGLRLIHIDVCRRLLTERADQAAAQAAADQARAEQQRQQQEILTAREQAEREAREARAERQRKILEDSPGGMTAIELMIASSGDDNRWDHAGKRFDQYIAAERAGEGGFGYTFGGQPPKE